MGRGLGFRRRQGYGGQVGWGRGFGRGFGSGTGFGWGRWAAPYYGNAAYLPPTAIPYASVATREQELEMLKSQEEGFQGALQDVQQRISELETEKKDK